MRIPSGAVDHGARLAPVVGVGVRADEQPCVLQPQADLVQRPVELGLGVGLVHPAVEQDEARA